MTDLKGKVVKITGEESLKNDKTALGIITLGSYGVVLDKAYGGKWMVRFIESVCGKGGLCHTVLEGDLEVIGETYKK